MLIPQRMRHLPLDRRGFPIPASVLVDADGRAHFQITDEAKRQRLIRRDACPLCGLKLGTKRWLCGGPRSAFDPHGAYIDPPMHDECCHFALVTCPFLAAPNYSKRIDERTLKPEDREKHMLLKMEENDDDRPLLFVAIEVRRTREIREGKRVLYLRPLPPYTKVEYWQHGHQISEDRALEIMATIGTVKVRNAS